MKSAGFLSRRSMVLTAASWLATPRLHAAARPFRLVVGAPAGGPSDALARMLAEALGPRLGASVVVENRGGAGGAIAAAHVAHSFPDGRTVLLSTLSHAVMHSMLARAPADLLKDFVHVTQLVASPNVIAASPDVPFASLADMLDHARTRPEELAYASSGNGSSGHLAVEMLKQRAACSLLHIPYGGGAAATQAFLAGDVPLLVINLDGALPHVRRGRMRILAITSQQRNPLLPQTQTVAESGHAGFDATSWAGLSLPRGTPPRDAVALHAASVRALRDIEPRQSAIGATVIGSGSDDYDAFVRDETHKWGAVIRDGRIHMD